MEGRELRFAERWLPEPRRPSRPSGNHGRRYAEMGLPLRCDLAMQGQAFQHAAPHVRVGDFGHALGNRKLAVGLTTVRDVGLGIAFRVRSPRFEPTHADRAVDVTLTACAADLLLLATRRSDPDTLLFDRRRLIEGDTETGLRLENILDAIELPRWFPGA